MKKLTFWTVFVLIILSSCTTAKKCTKKFPPQAVTIIKDSIREIVVYRDTTIYIYLQGETVTVWDTVYIKNGVTVFRQVEAHTNLADAVAWIGQNKINLTLTDKDTTLTIKLNNAIKTAHYWEKIASTKSTTVEVKYIPKFVKVLSWLGIAGIILALLWLLKKFKVIG